MPYSFIPLQAQHNFDVKLNGEISYRLCAITSWQFKTKGFDCDGFELHHSLSKFLEDEVSCEICGSTRNELGNLVKCKGYEPLVYDKVNHY